MGKKRRLLHSKKFAVKHRTHPIFKVKNESKDVNEVEQDTQDTKIITTNVIVEPPSLIMSEPISTVIEATATKAPATVKDRETAPVKKKKTVRKATSAKKTATKRAPRKTATKKTTKTKTQTTSA